MSALLFQLPWRSLLCDASRHVVVCLASCWLFIWFAYAAVFFFKSVPTLSFRGVPFPMRKSLIFPPARNVPFRSLFLWLHCTVLSKRYLSLFPLVILSAGLSILCLLYVLN